MVPDARRRSASRGGCVILLTYDTQRLALAVHFNWVWGAQCECGAGHVHLAIYVGPLLLEVCR